MLALEALNQILLHAPAHGVSIGMIEDRESWRIDFKAEATESERAAAIAHLAEWSPSEELLAAANPWAALGIIGQPNGR